MKESVAIAKDAAAKKESSPTKSSDNSIHRVRNEPERKLGSLREVIATIRRDGSTPSVDSIATELSGMHTAQRASVLLALQQTHGNQYVQRVVTGIQAKLKVGQPGDKYEQEADRVAEQVMHMPEPMVRQPEEEEKEEELLQTKPIAEQISPLVQRQVEEGEEEEEILQTKENPGLTPEVTPDFESRIPSLKGSGQPLPEANRGFMERRFGIDFSGVRLHTDSDAAQMSRELNAEAFTYGRDIYFGAVRYSPGTLSGKRLLAHELTHVVQQQSMEGTIRRFPADEDECPDYQPGEISTSRTASGHLDPDVTLHAPSRLLIADFGVGRQSVKPSTQAEPLLRSWLSTFESDNSYRLEIIGYSDCVGSDSINTRIRHGRAEQTERLLGPGVRSRVTFRGMAGLGDYVTNNNTVENRARNRGVIIQFRREITLPPIIISGTPGCVTPTNPNLWGRAHNPTTDTEVAVTIRHPIDALSANSAANDARAAAGRSGLAGPHLGPQDAFRHCVWNGFMAQRSGAVRAEQFATGHENSGPSPIPFDNQMDLHNNATGRGLGTPGANCEAECMRAVTSGRLRTIRGPHTRPRSPVPTTCIGASDQPWP